MAPHFEPADLAPLDYMVIAIDDCAAVPTEAVREILALESAEIVRIIDVIVVGRRADGHDEIETPSLPAAHPLAVFAGRTHDLLTHDDLDALTRELPDATSAMVFVLEHRWASEFEQEMRRGGATVTGRGPVRRDMLIASLQAAGRPAGFAPRRRGRPRVTDVAHAVGAEIVGGSNPR